MIKKIIVLFFVLFFLPSCGNKEECKDECCKKEKNADQQNVSLTLQTNGDLKCKLTSPELQKRKETVLAELKNAVLDRKELFNGYSFKFKGDDETINKLIVFIQSERTCCDFFTFNLRISGDKSSVWLDMTGSSEAKKFIKDEMELTDSSLTSEITCPVCGFKKIETMPTEICQLSYTCTKCGKEMHPKNGDCCVFCSYGDKKCPSMQ